MNNTNQQTNEFYKQLLNILREDFRKWAEENSDISQAIIDKLIDKSRLTEDELDRPESEGGYEGSIVKVSLERFPILRIGGEPDKIVFSAKTIVFLKSKNADFAIFIIKNKRPEILTAIIPIEKEDGYELEKIFAEEKINLKWAYFNVKGWSLFSTS